MRYCDRNDITEMQATGVISRSIRAHFGQKFVGIKQEFKMEKTRIQHGQTRHENRHESLNQMNRWRNVIHFYVHNEITIRIYDMDMDMDTETNERTSEYGGR